jgi:hypothetical protein
VEYDDGWVSTPREITKVGVAACLQTGTETITSFNFNGGAGEAYETDDHVGFTFTLNYVYDQETLGALFEYKVGSALMPVAGQTPAQPQELAPEKIAGYIQNRASQTIAFQPNLIGLLSGASAGNFNAGVTRSNGNFDFATSGDQPVWAMLQGMFSDNHLGR